MKRIKFNFTVLIIMVVFTGCLTTAPVSKTVKDPSASDLEDGFIIDEKSLYEYDENGFPVKEDFFENVDGRVEKTVIVNEYENNLLTSKKYYDSYNNLKEYKIFSYDEDGRISRETEYKPDGSVKNYKDFEYSENASYIKKYFKDNGKLYRYIIKKYDSSGKLTEHSDYEKK